jgi:hypothetical protein
MRSRKVEGICRICGQKGPLSFEHIPPEGAFNNRPVITATFEETIELGPDSVAKGQIQQRGMGYHTLCEKCNNTTGHWYGNEFIDWCYQGMEILIRANGKPTIIPFHYLLPLPILKQIVTMFFSVNHENFHRVHEELVNFVLNRDRKYLDPKYRFFVYYNSTGRLRAAGSVGLMDINTSKICLVSEITYPPFGYVMTINSDPPDKRLVEITHFSRYGYYDVKIMSLELPVLPTYLSIPGDYREKERIYEDAAMNAALATEIKKS